MYTTVTNICEIPLANKSDGLDTDRSSMWGKHSDSLTTVLDQLLLTYKHTSPPSDLPVTVGSLSTRKGTPKPSISKSAGVSCSLCLSKGEKTHTHSSSILLRRDWTLARMTVGRGIRRKPCLLNLWRTLPRLPRFLTRLSSCPARVAAISDSRLVIHPRPKLKT